IFGKVVGIGAVGLTQVLFWLILLIILFFAGGSIITMFMNPEDLQAMSSGMADGMAGGMTEPTAQMEMLDFFNNFSMSPWILVAFLFYFLAGYFIYSSLFAA